MSRMSLQLSMIREPLLKKSHMTKLSGRVCKLFILFGIFLHHPITAGKIWYGQNDCLSDLHFTHLESYNSIPLIGTNKKGRIKERKL